MQDRMHWSFRVGRKAGRRKMWWVGWAGMKWEEKTSLHSGPHAGAARAIMWMETISFPGFSAEVEASVFPQLNFSVSVSLAPFRLLPPLIYTRKIIVKIISTVQSACGAIPLCLSGSHKVTHTELHADPLWLFLLRSWSGVNWIFNTLCPGCEQCTNFPQWFTQLGPSLPALSY